MRRPAFAFLAACLVSPALLVGVGCSSSTIATNDGGVIPDGWSSEGLVLPDLGPTPDGGPIDLDSGPIDLDAGPIEVDLGWIDVDLGPAIVCGDATLTPPEQCDDGNTDPGDGCDATCHVESDVCPGGVAPRALVPGTTLTGDTSGTTSAASGTCGGGTAGENAFTFTVYSESDVTLTTDFPATTFNAAVYVRTTCADRTTELGCASAAPAGDALTLTALPPGTYFAFVDGAGGASGAYEVGITLTPRLAIGDLCDPMGTTGLCVDGAECTADAAGVYRCRTPASICADSAGTLTLGAAATGGTTLGADDRYAPSCSNDGAAPERIFRVTVPAGAHDLVVTARPTNFAADSFDVVLTVETMCGLTASAVGCSDARAADATESVVVLDAAGEYFILVDGYGTSATMFTSGEFEVEAHLRDVIALGGACDSTGTAGRCADGTACLGSVCSAITVITDASPNALFCDAQGPSTGDTLFVGNLTTGGAADWDTVEVDLASPAALAISTSDGAGGCTADTLVEVFDGTGTTCGALDGARPPPAPIASDDNSGLGGLCSSLTTGVLAAGTYYVRVRRALRTGAPGGAYELLIDSL